MEEKDWLKETDFDTLFSVLGEQPSKRKLLPQAGTARARLLGLGKE
jgi:hypothetical protein